MSESTHTMDPTFYRTPSEAIAAPTEQLAYVVAFDRAAEKPDALTVLDTDPGSSTYGQSRRSSRRSAAGNSGTAGLARET